jgi:hypothetical protein
VRFLAYWGRGLLPGSAHDDFRLCKRRAINKRSDTRAIPTGDPNNKLEYMKPIVQTANVEEAAIPLKEVIPFWFAVFQPAARFASGLIGSMVCCLA